VSKAAVEHLDVNGVKVELRRQGKGPTLLYLHGHLGLWQSHAFLDALAQDFTVLTPSAPGFEGSPTVDHFTVIDDLAYLYLDLLDQLDLNDVVLAGSSMGGWLAMAIAIKGSRRIMSLALLNPTGVHFGGPEDESIGDIFSMAEGEFAARGFADPEMGRKNYAEWTDQELLTSSRNREAAARYGWMPCLYDPKLLHWLHRVTVPTVLLWGEADRITCPDYAEQLARALPDATLVTMAGAGHFPHMEKPDEAARQIAAFMRTPALAKRGVA
jgi:pimeloyl-ACP methyl ester carboxylesterase